LLHVPDCQLSIGPCSKVDVIRAGNSDGDERRPLAAGIAQALMN